MYPAGCWVRGRKGWGGEGGEERYGEERVRGEGEEERDGVEERRGKRLQYLKLYL